MKILIYAINFTPELTGCGKYTGEKAARLVEMGHDVRVITAVPYYPDWRIDDSYSNRYFTEELDDCKVFRCPLYVPKKVTTLKRLVHLLSFACLSLPQLFRQITWKPDVIIQVEPTFFCTPGTLLFSFITKAKSWLHVQDFELDAMLGLGMYQKKSFMSKLAIKAESLLLRCFDRVSTISCSMQNKLLQKGVRNEKIYYLPNWVDVEFVSPNADRGFFRKKWGYNEDDIIFLYSGNIGRKQGLEIIIPAAKHFREHENVHFVIVGQGAFKDELWALVNENELKNIKFYDLQPYELLPNLLRMADFHLVIQKKGVAGSMMPSKLTSIFSVGGTAIISAEKESELGKFALENPGFSILTEPEDASLFADLLVELVIGFEQQDYNVEARNYAKNNLSVCSILPEMSEELNRISRARKFNYGKIEERESEESALTL